MEPTLHQPLRRQFRLLPYLQISLLNKDRLLIKFLALSTLQDNDYIYIPLLAASLAKKNITHSQPLSLSPLLL